MIEEVYCPTCQSEMVLKKGKYSEFYSCSRYPECKETHGAHPDGSPMGKPATSEVRKLRIVVHKKLNEIWSYEDREQRKEMYRWLVENTESGHVAMMGKEEIEDLLIKLGKYIYEEKTKTKKN